MKALIVFLSALTELIKLGMTLYKNWKQSESEKKFKEEVAHIRKAFKEQDAQMLNDNFNNKPSRGLSDPSA